MATLKQLNTEIESIKASQESLSAKIDEFKLEATNAFNRLNQKIAQGSDTQPAIDALAPLGQVIAVKTQEIESAIAEAKLEG